MPARGSAWRNEEITMSTLVANLRRETRANWWFATTPAEALSARLLRLPIELVRLLSRACLASAMTRVAPGKGQSRYERQSMPQTDCLEQQPSRQPILGGREALR
eukprot:363031-Chlamydomonas_euryale.AAC.2